LDYVSEWEEGSMPEFGGEGLDQLEDRISQLSADQARNVRSLLEWIERRRVEAREKDWNFVAPKATQLIERLQRGNTPCFIGLQWSGSTGSPGTMQLSVDGFNPDPVAWSSLYVHVFTGPANLAGDVAPALALVDARFPRLTEPETFGLYMDPGDSATLDFDIAVPAKIEPSNYLGNCFLPQVDAFAGAGDTLHRNVFVFEVP
jgi:hypothetical protein